MKITIECKQGGIFEFDENGCLIYGRHHIHPKRLYEIIAYADQKQMWDFFIASETCEEVAAEEQT